MRKAKIFFNGIPAGLLIEQENGHYQFEYFDDYRGAPISLTLPIIQKKYDFDSFPPFFDGLLPEGASLEALLKQAKLDRSDFFGQLVTVGADMVGAVTAEEVKES
ncbi:MAG: HipA N-terminal domain-containing protein [Deltaproteobacteria bacterium]|nr:HipA N-terminal domain-containing protein [Deltaproteobacteria bacterium]